METQLSAAHRQLEAYGLLRALRERRSRRFPLGANFKGGPLSFDGTDLRPEPLTEEEEALLAFAASGITGYALADLPYPEGGSKLINDGTTILAQFFGRTAPSGDALNSV